MRERMAYLHVPKSAGTTQRRALLDHFPIGTHVPWRLDTLLYGGHPLPGGPVDRLYVDEVERPVGRHHPFTFMAGHLSLPSIEEWFDAADVATILREPRTRLLSQYTFWRTYPYEEVEYWLPYEGTHYRNLPFGEFLRHPAMAHFTDNLTTRLIVGRHPLIPLDAPIADHDLDEVVAIGCANLDRIGFVDVIERGDDTHTGFEAWVGVPLRAGRENVTDPEAGVPVEVDDFVSVSTQLALGERNRADAALWRHAAGRNGIDPDAADRLADATYASAMARATRRAVDAWRRIDASVGLVP